MARVLIVDDDEGMRESAAIALESVGHRTFRASDAASALQLLREHRVDVVLSDIYMPGDDGLALLQAIKGRHEPPHVILMTARGSIETTALAQRIGAFDYLAKPFDLSELIDRVASALAVAAPAPAEIEPGPPSRMVGSHRSMVEMYKAIARVAPMDVPVLILGDSGSGKELVAASIHDLSNRSKAPFIPLNCGAIPDTLLENELFGSTRGAFTDSRQDRRGVLSRADGGTLFLDEIGDISAAFQVKLLRFLQDGTVTPLGSDKSHRVSVRIIAATHRDIKRLVTSGTFREDLYYRLAGYEIRVPPLRERLSDLPLLIEHFRHRLLAEMRRDAIAGPTQAVLDVLASHSWPGNIRELEQVIRRTVIDSGALSDPVAAARALRAVAPSPSEPALPATAVAEPAQSASLGPLEDAERRHIAAVLKATSWNQTQAAFILGIER
ncbi:MAG: sigma-54 dependent transcriptional regulator, partial [Acidobacteriota bacterium]